MLFDERFDLQTDQLIQTHFQNGICLPFGKFELLCHNAGFSGFKLNPRCIAFDQTFFCHCPILGAAQNFNDQVNDTARLDQTFLYFSLFLLLLQEIVVLSCIDLKLEVNDMLQDRFQPHCFRSAVCNRQHIDTKGVFQLGLFI